MAFFSTNQRRGFEFIYSMTIDLKSRNRNQLINEKSNKMSTPVDSSIDGSMNQCKVALNMSKDLVAAAGFNVETPIVNALIGNLNGSLPTKKSDATETVRCEICDCDISSSVTMSFHLNGAKHKKKLKALEIISQLKADNKNEVTIGDNGNPNNFRCDICCLTVNSAQQLEFHLSGIKHQKKAIKAGVIKNTSESQTDSTVKQKLQQETQSQTEIREKNSEENCGPPPPKIKKKEEPKVYPCDLCNVVMNSEVQYNQHLSSKKHSAKLSLNKRLPLKRSFVPMKSAGGFPSLNFTSRFQNGTNLFNKNKPQPYNESSNPIRKPFFNMNSNQSFSNNSNNFKKPFRNFNNLQKESRIRPSMGNSGGPLWFGSNFQSF